MRRRFAAAGNDLSTSRKHIIKTLMQLKLTRPLVFFDIEATGLSISTDRIVELCYIKVMPDGQEFSESTFQPRPLQ